MDYQSEILIRDLIDKSYNEFNISFPAVVINVDNLSSGLVDVKPIVNYMNSKTGDTTEYPVLYDVPVIFPNTKRSSICFPVEQGDTVLLLFQSNYVRDFIDGNRDIQNPPYYSSSDLSQVVAYVGFVPYQDSCFDANNYQTDFDKDDLNIVHNKGTKKEVSITLNSDGSISLDTLKDINVTAKNVNIKSAEVNIDNDLKIKGSSVYQFMKLHTHVDSRGGNTSPPNGV